MDELKIVKGNTFETIIKVKAYKYNGEEIQDFNLASCTDIKVTAHVNGMAKTIDEYSILEDNKMSIVWPANTTGIGSYSLEVRGKSGVVDWRFYDKKPIFIIVNTNKEANLPQQCVIKDGCYANTQSVYIILSAKGDKGDPGTTDYNDLINKPDIPQNLSDLQDDSEHRTVSDSEKQEWNQKLDVLTFDEIPVYGSNNPVKSGGVYNKLNNVYTKEETYSKEQLNNMITTPNQEYITLTAEEGDTLTDIFDGITGAADTIYRVSNWDGTQYDTTVYSEYAWDGTQYLLLDVKVLEDVLLYSPQVLTEAEKEQVQENLGLAVNKKNCTFDFSTGSVSQYTNRNTFFKFVKGHKYTIAIQTEDDSTTTYFSVRNDAGNIVDNLNELIIGKGARSDVFTCTSDEGTRFYMSYREDGAAISYNVVIEDSSISSLEDHIEDHISNLEDTVPYNVSKEFPTGGANGGNTYTLRTALSKVPQRLQKGGMTITFISSESGKYEVWHLNSDTWQSSYNSGYWECRTEIVRALCNNGTPIFEFGGLSIINNELDYYSTSTEIRTKRDTFVYLEAGTTIHLHDYTNAKFRVFYVNGENLISVDWQTSDWVTPITTKYYIKIKTIDNSSINLDYYSSLLVLYKYNPDSASIKIIDNLLEIGNNQIPYVAFSKTGHFVRTDGTVGNSTNWYQSNIFRVLKSQTVVIDCSATGGNAVIMALTDQEGSFYSPVVMATQGQTITTYEYIAKEDCYLIVQYYQIRGVINIYNDSQRLLDVEGDVDNINNALSDALIPEYVEQERDRVYRELIERVNSNNLFVAFNTDQHFNGSSIGTNTDNDPKFVRHGLKSLSYIAETIPLDCIVLGGDVAGYNGSSITVDGIIEDISILHKHFASVNVPLVSIPGNHDAYQNNGNITSMAMYNTHFKRSNILKDLEHTGIDNCDCYFDDVNSKIRYIFVDTYTRNTRVESFTDFLTGALSTMPSNYMCLIFSHNPLTSEFAGIVTHTLYNGNEGNAFSGPAQLQSTLNPYADKIIACICGHSHDDVWAVSNSGILYIETTTAAPHTVSHNGIIPYQRTKGTATETAFDIFVVNMEQQTIEAIRYGQGTNRKWKYKGTGQGLISYKNCVYGKASVGNVELVFTSQEPSDTVSVTCDSLGNYEVYLLLGVTYNISCQGYSVDIEEVEVDENKKLDITLTIES